MKRSTDQIADEFLARRCQAGSAKALEVLIERWQERLWRHAVRLTREPSLADDVLQESLIAIARGIHRLDGPARFRSWAYRIVSNKVADCIQQRQRRRAAESTAADHNVDSSLPSSTADPVERVRIAMLGLDQKDRAILALFYLDEMTVIEVADICGIPYGTVKSRLYHARKKLKSVLEKETRLTS